MTTTQDLIARLHKGQSYDFEDVAMDMSSVMDEAAETLQALQAENAAVRAANIDCVNHFDALRIDYESALARLAEIAKQEPVTWGMVSQGVISDVICPETHEAYEGAYTVPLFAAAGASPVEPSQAGDDLRDAKRYRFLRYRMNSSAQFLNEPGEILSEQYLDAAIDAAINAKERT